MKTFKKSLILMASVLGIFALTACSSNEEKGGAQEGDTISINIAYGNQPDEPLGQQAEKWKELAEEKSDGKLELNLYPSSQLGSEKDVVEQAISGNNVIVFRSEERRVGTPSMAWCSRQESRDTGQL